jgi:hypothetical protein
MNETIKINNNTYEITHDPSKRAMDMEWKIVCRTRKGKKQTSGWFAFSNDRAELIEWAEQDANRQPGRKIGVHFGLD